MTDQTTTDSHDFIFRKPLELFEGNKTVKICAPMVRYSKLPFRMLVRKYGCDLAFTPMIIANSFVQSLKARDNEFTTCKEDRPLIVQFAAHNAKDLADAAEIVSPFTDGVDLNCGCPQRWAMAEGYGACLINKPELVSDMVKQTKNRVTFPDFTVSIKIRIHDDIRKTVDLCQKMEATGVSWISVHGRTKEQRNQPVNLEAIKVIRESVGVPVVANGDIKSLEDVTTVTSSTGVQVKGGFQLFEKQWYSLTQATFLPSFIKIGPLVYEEKMFKEIVDDAIQTLDIGPAQFLSVMTLCSGVMAARGMLQNPAMYAGYDNTPLECVKNWTDIALQMGTTHSTFHHHLMYMLERIMSRSERVIFNSIPSTPAVIDYLANNFGV